MTFQPEVMLLLANRKPAQVFSPGQRHLRLPWKNKEEAMSLYVTLGRSVTGTTISKDRRVLPQCQRLIHSKDIGLWIEWCAGSGRWERERTSLSGILRSVSE